MMISTSRSSKGFFDRPTTINSGVQRSEADSCSFGPLRENHAVSFKGIPLHSSFISILLRASCPFTIRFFISFVVVNSFKSMFPRRLFAHIIEKSLKIVPLFAKSNTSSSVSWIGHIFRVKTSIPGTNPRSIFRRFSQAVRSITLTHPAPNFLLVATARNCISVFQHKRTADRFFSTITDANPTRPANCRPKFANPSHNKKTTKYLLREIFEYRHVIYCSNQS